MMMSEKENEKNEDKQINKEDSTKKTVTFDDGYESDDAVNFNNVPDPLYDPDIDDEDEKYVKDNLVPNNRMSDATLSCPACFEILCYDCQRHENYKTQFRAIFAQNVRVGLVPLPRHGCLPIYCSSCSTEVGAFDEENIFHFFHVLEAA